MSCNDLNYNVFINGNKRSGCACPSSSCPPKPCQRCCVGPTGPQGPAGMQGLPGLPGATGPTGAAGASILGSYETYAAFIAAHPTGNPGDAYLVGGVLYVWGGTPASWQNMGSLVGPTGPAGMPILGSYETYAELIIAHPTGNPGDAYLAGGVLYVWGGTPASWQNMGSLLGPTGPTGDAGPTGPVGNDGVDGLIGQIEGVVGTVGDLPATGVEQGTIFYVEEDNGVYIWDETAGEWKKINVAQGPRGATGPTGPTGPSGADGIMGPIQGVVATAADLPTTGVEQGTLFYVEDENSLYVWDAVNGWTALGMVQGPRGATGATGAIGATGPAGSDATSATIIPFASQQAPLVGTNNGGLPTDAALIGFGYVPDAYVNAAVDIDPNDRSFNLSGTANRQVAFSLPFDMRLNSIYITVGNYAAFIAPLPPSGVLVYPYVQIYAAEAGTNSFSPIADAFAKPEQGIDPQSAQPGTMRFAIKDGLDIGLRAGTRIAICGMMELPGDTGARSYYLYFTGGLGMTRWVE